MSIDIDRPIEEVFSAFLDVRTQPQWDPGLIEGRNEPDGPPKLGTKITEVRKFMGKVSENTSELVEFEANKKTVRKGKDGPMSLIAIHTFTETDAGTHINWIWTLEISGLLKLMTPIIAFQLKRSAKPLLSNLKELLENNTFKPLD